jgi:hypothetical protein
MLDILFKANAVELGSLTLDASLSEDHASEVELTDNPVETGVNITDHKRKKPAQVTIVGVISNTPLEFLSFLSGLNDRAETAWQTLKDLQAGEELLTIVTTLQVYENMQIVSLSAPRNKDLGNTLEFTAVCREVFTADSETVEAPTVARPPKAKAGVKPTSEVTGPKQTLAAKLADTLSGMFGGP